MTVTWKDYTGPNLSTGVGFSFYHREDEDGYCSACDAERNARKKWADEQNSLVQGRDYTATEIEQLTTVRTFDTGANRDKDEGKLDFEGFLSPLVLEAFATYMNFNRSLADGSTRASDNWQKGIPVDVYVKSAWRHFFSAWRIHRGWGASETLVWALCGVLFNVQGWLHELLKKDGYMLQVSLEVETARRNANRAAGVKDTSQPQSAARAT